MVLTNGRLSRTRRSRQKKELHSILQDEFDMYGLSWNEILEKKKIKKRGGKEKKKRKRKEERKNTHQNPLSFLIQYKVYIMC